MAVKHDVNLVGCRARSQPRKKNKKKTHNQEKKKEKSFSPTSETPRQNLRRCLARSKTLGHSGETINKGTKTTAKLNVACPRTPGKVGAVGAGQLVRVEKKQTKNNSKSVIPPHMNHNTPNAADHGEKRYVNQVCYEGSTPKGEQAKQGMTKQPNARMHATPPPLHVHRCVNQVCYKGRAPKEEHTHDDEKRNNHMHHAYTCRATSRYMSIQAGANTEAQEKGIVGKEARHGSGKTRACGMGKKTPGRVTNKEGQGKL